MCSRSPRGLTALPLAALALLALAGCAGGPAQLDRAATQPAISAQFAPPVAGNASSAAATASSDFIARLGDDGLSRLVARAEAGNPALAASLARMEMARAGLDRARAERAPGLDASAGITTQRNSLDQIGANIPPGFAANVNRNQTLLRPALTARFDLDLFGRLKAEARAAGARLDAASADAGGVRVALRADIATQWLAARTASARIALARDIISRAQTIATLVQSRVHAGLAGESEVASARAALAEAQAALPPLLADRAVAIAALTALTTVPREEVEAMIGQAGEFVPADLRPETGLPSDLLRRRPDIVAAEARLRAADADLAAAAARRFPSLTLTGTFGTIATALSGVFTGNALAASAGVELAGPLFDFGRIGALVKEREGARAEAIAAYRTTVLDAIAEVDTAIAQASAGSARAEELARRTGERAREASLAVSRHRAGLDGLDTALSAEINRLRAQDDVLVARSGAAQAGIALWRAAGG